MKITLAPLQRLMLRAKLPKQMALVAALHALMISSSAQSVTCQQLHTANKTTLHGVIVLRVYPGPPNYGVGSDRESVKALRLDKEICFTRSDSEEFPKDANLVQLYFDAEASSLARRALPGCYARIEGELFKAESGHHHTPFVLAVTSVTELRGCQRKTTDPPAKQVATSPNPSVKRGANGGPPGPGHGCWAHFPWPGPVVPPTSPAYLER